MEIKNNIMGNHLEAIRSKCGTEDIVAIEFRDNKRIHIPAEKIYIVLKFLKETSGFDML